MYLQSSHIMTKLCVIICFLQPFNNGDGDDDTGSLMWEQKTVSAIYGGFHKFGVSDCVHVC